MKAWAWIAAIIICGVIFLLIMKSRVPDMVASNLSKKLKTEVSIDTINFFPSSITVKNFQIANSRGYTLLPKAFSSEEIAIQAPLTRYFNNQIVIDQIEVDNIYLGLEFDSASSTNGNWTVLMSNYQKNTNLNKSKDANRSVLIKTLILRNISIDLVFLSDSGKVKKLPKIKEIQLNNVTSEGGELMDQLMNTVLGQMLKSVFQKENLQNMLKDLLQPDKALEQIIKPFKGIFYLPRNELHKDAS